jgi:hypothetical protein
MCSYLFLTSQFFISGFEPSFYQGLILLVLTCDNLQKPQEISHCTQTTSDREVDSSNVLLKSTSALGFKPRTETRLAHHSLKAAVSHTHAYLILRRFNTEPLCSPWQLIKNKEGDLGRLFHL